MRLKDKTALITGGNSGIGLATARLFVAEGARVAITGRNQRTLDAAVAELGANALAIRADAGNVEDTERAVAAVAERFGPIDVVFANAGIAGSTPLGQTTRAAFEAVLQTNVTGVFFTVQAALPHLRAGASVILNGSVIASLGSPTYSAYAASKAAARSMARVMAAELAPRRIRVNIIVPGATDTPIWDARAPSPAERAGLEAFLARTIPLNRLGAADEIAKAVLFLASDDASYITGAELVVDGGSTGAPGGAPAYRTA